jgi:hypothetical protein
MGNVAAHLQLVSKWTHTSARPYVVTEEPFINRSDSTVKMGVVYFSDKSYPRNRPCRPAGL